MSRCSIIEFRDNKPNTETEFGNSWGGAARIWDALFNRYLKDPNKEYDNWLSRCRGNDNSLWDLAKRKGIPEFARAAHVATFDYAIVNRENFTKLAGHLREFAKAYPASGVDHLDAWAAIIEASDAEAIGFHHTSVSENLWFGWDGEKQESIPYDLSTGDKHFDVYDAIADYDNEPEGEETR